MTRAIRTTTVMLLILFLLAIPAMAATETPLVTGGADQGDPAAGDLGWAWTIFTKTSFTAMANTGGSDFQVNPAKTFGAVGGIDGETLIYQRVGRSGSDIAAFDLLSETQMGLVPKVNTRFWEWGASISGDWVLLNRNNINYGARKEWQRVMLVNTATGDKRVLAQLPATRYTYLNAGQVNGNWAAWESYTRKAGWKVTLYDIGAKSKTSVKGIGNREPYAPAVAEDGTVYYSISGAACGRNVSIVRRNPGGSREIIHNFPTGTDAWELYEYTNGLPAQDLFYSRVDCGGRVWKGDVYAIYAADTSPPLAPVVSPAAPEAQAGPEAAHRLPPVLPEATRPAA